MAKLRDIMTSNVETIRPFDTLGEAARRMKELDVGVLPVCDGDRLLGMLTDRDIVIRSVAENRHPDQVRVSDAMTRDVEWCFEDDSVSEAARLMRSKQIRRIVVLNRDKRLVGIVSLGDVATTSSASQSGQTLEAISEPTGISPAASFFRGLTGVSLGALGVLAVAGAMGGYEFSRTGAGSTNFRFSNVKDRFNSYRDRFAS